MALLAVRRGRIRLVAATVALASMTLVALPESAQGESRRDSANRIKAAYVYKLLGFVTWPDGSGPDLEEKIEACALAGDEFVTALGAIDGRRIGSRTVALRRVTRTDEVESCSVLVVDMPTATVAAALKRTDGRPILTIGNVSGFAQMGGIIGFVEVDDTVRFELNLAAALDAGVEISSHVRGLATAIHGRPGTP